jgi:hypothetical protein
MDASHHRSASDLPSSSRTSTLRAGEDLRVIAAAKLLLPPRSTIEQPASRFSARLGIAN